ncbi:hypothetical protein [Reyranella sp.]|uniref:hypothetical protein n=1 Tax=Reyranella sp. TaxID=1929291 RepID=UPI00273052EE|nr:hypothetical protein [Reyranella sp.]MDP2375072.1 hypothetical protein [Reyranella sp.]
MYAHLADAAPDLVFDNIAAVLVGPGAREGYHYEGLASDGLVKLVRRYLADHRAIFEDQDKGFDAASARRPRGPELGRRETAEILSEALDCLKANKKASPTLAIWVEWLRDLQTYVASLAAQRLLPGVAKISIARKKSSANCEIVDVTSQ